MQSTTFQRVSSSCCALVLAAAPLGAQCREWNASLAMPGTGPVFAFANYDDGTGPSLYAGGLFNPTPANYLAKWDGASWVAVPGSPNGSILAFAVFDDGNGPMLYAGGMFNTAGGNAAPNIARFDGTTWSDVGGGCNFAVNCMVVFDDGNGPALYVGGDFDLAGGIPANRVAKWDGATWSALGAGLPGACGGGEHVDALAVFDDGGGPALYAGGEFNMPVPAGCGPGIAKWTGSTWASLNQGLGGVVYTMRVHDDGTGPALYLGGHFNANLGSGVFARNVVRWNGATWSALGAGLGGPSNSVSTLTTFDDGAGPALYAGGSFLLSAGVGSVAKWDGWAWSGLGVPHESIDGEPMASIAFDADRDGTDDLHFGGYSVRIGPSLTPPYENVVTWGGCGETPGSFFCTPGVAGVANCPCAPPDTVPSPQSALDHGCANTFNLDGAQLLAVGTTSPDTLHLQIPVGQFYAGFGFLVKGNALDAGGMTQGDGVRCVSGQLIRFGGHNAGTNGNPSGTWIYPNTVQTVSVSAATAQLGGETAHYQLYYRNAQANFCSSGTINWSGGRSVAW